MNAFIKNVVIVGVGIAVSISLSLWLLLPALKNLTNLNHELVDQKTELVNLQQQIRAYQTAESDLKKAIDKQDILNAIVIKEDVVVPIQEVEASLSKTGTSDGKLTITDPFAVTTKVKGAKKDEPAPIVGGLNNVVLVPYSLSAKNDYAGTIDLFSYLEHLPHFTEISAFKMSAENSESSIKLSSVAEHTGKVQTSIEGIFFAKDATTKN